MAVKIDLARKTMSLGVGDLLAEALGTRGAAGSWTRARLAIGREVHTNHQRSQAELHERYAKEVAVRFGTVVEGFKVTIQGRIDGVYPPPAKAVGHHGEQWIIEEIKSVVLPPLMFAALDANSHPPYVEQLRLYCFFVVQETGCGREAAPPAAGVTHRGRKAGRARKGAPPRADPGNVTGRMVYVNALDDSRKEIEILGPFNDCERLIAERVRILIGRAYDEEAQRESRRRRSTDLHFPHANPRKHQDRMIAAIETALAEGRHLMVSAPSGIGKTAAALYPTVKYALANDKRVFFVTAKNTQQAIAVETLRRMEGRQSASGRKGQPVAPGKALPQMNDAPTAVSFRAREKMCINDVYACHEEFCQHLRDVPAKLERTRVIEKLLAQRLILPEVLMEAGKQARLCPFELALLEAELTDVIVCDYNYVFDPQVYFRRFFQDEDYSNAILIIDEAHNLLPRAMDYYSPVLRRRQVRELMADMKHLRSSLREEIREFLVELDDAFPRIASLGTGEQKFLIDSPRPFFDELKPVFNRLTTRYLLDKIGGGRVVPDDPVEDFFSVFGQFCAVLAMEGEEFSHVFDDSEEQSIKIVCKDPSRPLARRIEGFHSVIAMSATLEPMEFYRQMLGFDPDRTDPLTLPSPFPRENRKIIVVPDVSTTFRQREGHYAKIAGIITTTAQARRGNYMALFPSYEFLRRVAERLEGEVRDVERPDDDAARREARPPGWQLIVQEPRMSETERQTLLDSLKNLDPPKLVMAVQGGLFAEGVDYPGELLSGVIVVSPALPQVGFERELMRAYFEQRYGKGFEFAYIYPGMNRVIQSVGRLIRSETDCGVAVLVCRRFAEPRYSALFPPDWRDDSEEGLGREGLAVELRRFWARIDGNPASETPLHGTVYGYNLASKEGGTSEDS